MKKQMAVLMAMVMAAGVCAGCGSSSGTGSKAAAETAASGASSETETTGEEKKEDEAKDEKDKAEEAVKPERVKIKVAYHPHITGVGGILNAIDNGYFEVILPEQFFHGLCKALLCLTAPVDGKDFLGQPLFNALDGF